MSPGDGLVGKTRFSASIPGAGDLDARWEPRAVETLIITGVLTN